MRRDIIREHLFFSVLGRNYYEGNLFFSVLGRNSYEGSLQGNLEEACLVRGERMVFKRGLAELPLEERKSKFCKDVIEGRIISNYVFPRTRYICGGCGEVSACRVRGWSMRSSSCV
jgi:hypothetical protein